MCCSIPPFSSHAVDEDSNGNSLATVLRLNQSSFIYVTHPDFPIKKASSSEASALIHICSVEPTIASLLFEEMKTHEAIKILRFSRFN